MACLIRCYKIHDFHPHTCLLSKVSKCVSISRLLEPKSIPPPDNDPICLSHEWSMMASFYVPDVEFLATR